VSGKRLSSWQLVPGQHVGRGRGSLIAFLSVFWRVMRASQESTGLLF
jgi:hypothetical protein